MQVIPVINCHFRDSECVLEKLNKINGFSEWVHLDIADGIFTFNKTWNEPEKWKEFNKNNLKLEVHLMVENPIDWAKKWLEAGANRIIFHYEPLNDKEKEIREILELAKNYNAEVMLAICPETEIKEIEPFLDKFNYFQILAVMPGPAGQNFLPSVLDKIKLLKQLKPDALVEVDGGITLESAKKVKEVGGDLIASGTFIFNNFEGKSVSWAIDILKNIN